MSREFKSALRDITLWTGCEINDLSVLLHFAKGRMTDPSDEVLIAKAARKAAGNGDFETAPDWPNLIAQDRQGRRIAWGDRDNGQPWIVYL
jgi:hypothetical protein